MENGRHYTDQVSDARDAARWRETLMHVGAAHHLGGQHFTLNTIRISDQMFLLKGSVAEHFTKCIDESIERRGTVNPVQSHTSGKSTFHWEQDAAGGDHGTATYFPGTQREVRLRIDSFKEAFALANTIDAYVKDVRVSARAGLLAEIGRIKA